ncbi:hypothetical protein FHS00_002603 [Limimaricola variabilis]|uniref:EF-hand domain-containing protein n=1 Tax=Limimaricola variabilis TaxID=1492771 RepID=A0ABR6HR22_9RHOB|nr:hypothetical protein [Limimaricola variabilis]MBB3713002.1 hypothetical protein [Limimaricola variabilis]
MSKKLILPALTALGLLAAGAASAQAIGFKPIDQNGDGFLDAAELEAAFGAAAAQVLLDDADGDGKVTADELLGGKSGREGKEPEPCSVAPAPAAKSTPAAAAAKSAPAAPAAKAAPALKVEAGQEEDERKAREEREEEERDAHEEREDEERDAREDDERDAREDREDDERDAREDREDDEDEDEDDEDERDDD